MKTLTFKATVAPMDYKDPTSGLDAAQCDKVVDYINKVAAARQMANPDKAITRIVEEQDLDGFWAFTKWLASESTHGLNLIIAKLFTD